MKNPLWTAVYESLQEVDALLSRTESFGEITDTAKIDSPTSGTAWKKVGQFKADALRALVAEDDLVEVRAKIRSKLDYLKAALDEHLTERESYHVLFAIVVLFDEMIQNRFLSEGQKGNWPPLQTELYKIDNGGEVFYDTLDDLLRKPATLPFIYEVFYLCLSNGFRGRHADNISKINEYTRKLETKVCHAAVPAQPPRANAGAITFELVPVRYYAVAVALVLASYGALRVVATYLKA